MAQNKKRTQSKAKARTQKSQPQQTVNEDLRSQQILAQTVVDTVTKQQERIKELEAQRLSMEADLKAKELALATKSVESSPQVTVDPNEATLAYVEYLEETILPKARNSSFQGTGLVMKNGKIETREISNVKQLEDLIEELKSGQAQVVAGTTGGSGSALPSNGFLTKLKKLVGA